MRSQNFAVHPEAMDKNEHQLPEGKLLAEAMQRDGRSARKIAEAAGLSDTRLRHIVNGYQPVGQGQRVSVWGPPETLARIGVVVGVTPEEFRAVGRDDAADAYRVQQSNDPIVLDINEALQELRDYLDGKVRTMNAPASALFIYSDLQLVDELRRRIADAADRGLEDIEAERLRRAERHAADTRHLASIEATRQRLSEPLDTTETSVPLAADEDPTPIERGQGHDENA